MKQGIRFRQALERGDFVVTCEMIPGRGAREEAQAKEFEHAKAVYATGRVHAISITDNPSGNPALSADGVALELHRGGVEPLVHFTCKDRSRNQMLSQLYAHERNGIENIIFMSGDYQSSGWNGTARPVFDLDPVQALQMACEMNEGLVVQSPRGPAYEASAHFFPGAVVNPFKYRRGEIIPQYLKLERKLISGARFLITQLGYDARKMQELILYLRKRGYDTPVLANVFLINRGAALLMRKGAIAGCVVSDELLAILEAEALLEDKGKAARIERAAKMVALARGLGYAGVHIGGFGITAETVGAILDRAEELSGTAGAESADMAVASAVPAADDWRRLAREMSYGIPGGDYLYEPEFDEAGHATGLNTGEFANASENIAGRKLFRGYSLSRFLHHWFLTPGKRFFPLIARVMDSKERKRGRNRRHGFEHFAKTVLYGCMDCGDCGLDSCVYTCPMAQCPKSQRNGPCGGSRDGWCEVYPGERYCIHYKAYHRLEKYGELHKVCSFITPPNNWTYYGTSAVGNYTHKRDNTAHRIPVSIGSDSPRQDSLRQDFPRQGESQELGIEIQEPAAENRQPKTGSRKPKERKR